MTFAVISDEESEGQKDTGIQLKIYFLYKEMTPKILILCLMSIHEPGSSFQAMQRLTILHLSLNSCFSYKVTKSDIRSLKEDNAF